MKDSIPLITWRGMLASLAIENPEHERAIVRLEILIDKFGPFRKLNLADVLLLYR